MHSSVNMDKKPPGLHCCYKRNMGQAGPPTKLVKKSRQCQTDSDLRRDSYRKCASRRFIIMSYVQEGIVKAVRYLELLVGHFESCIDTKGANNKGTVQLPAHEFVITLFHILCTFAELLKRTKCFNVLRAVSTDPLNIAFGKKPHGHKRLK